MNVPHHQLLCVNSVSELLRCGCADIAAAAAAAAIAAVESLLLLLSSLCSALLHALGRLTMMK